MRTFPNEDQVQRAAKALFSNSYAVAPEREQDDKLREELLDQLWAHASQGVHNAYLDKARFVVEAALGGPYA